MPAPQLPGLFMDAKLHHWDGISSWKVPSLHAYRYVIKGIAANSALAFVNRTYCSSQQTVDRREGTGCSA